MKETKFIEQNKHKWNEFEKELKSDRNEPENLSKLFIETTDDLSFSRTYYPNRSVRVYLNDIGQQIYHKLYKTKTGKKNSFAAFWSLNLPQVLWENRKTLYWSAGIFFLGMIIAILSSIYHPNFAEIILGESYINQTLENINNGDPMGIYGTTDPVKMFIEIGFNNIKVCLLVFILGVFAGVGTIYILLYNSIMVGTFLYFFYAKNLFHDAFYAVMLHGTLELSMIILSGMAGLVLAKGLVFPKSYSRMQSLIYSARQAIMIFIGVSVFLVIAAFIESFATRHTDVSNLIRGLVIFSSFAIVVSYFLVYPYLLNRNGKFEKSEEDELPPERISQVDFTKIKSAGVIFTEVFYFVKQFFNQHLKLGIAAGIIGSLSVFFVVGKEDVSYFLTDSFNPGMNPLILFLDVVYPWNEINNLFQFYEAPLLYPVFIILSSLVIIVSVIYFRKIKVPEVKQNYHLSRIIISSLITSTIILSPFLIHLNDAFSAFIIDALFLVFVFPIMILILITSVIEDLHWSSSLKRASVLLKGNYGKLISTSFFVFAMPWILCISCSSYLWTFITEVLSLNISNESELINYIPSLVQSGFMILVLTLAFPIYLYGIGILHSSLTEINEANFLHRQISKIKFKKKAYGIEQE